MQKLSQIQGNQEETQMWGKPQSNPLGRSYLHFEFQKISNNIIYSSPYIVYHNNDLKLSILAAAWQSHLDSQINQGLLIPRLEIKLKQTAY